MSSKQKILLLSLLSSVAAQDVQSSVNDNEGCYTSSSIFWAVIITIMILLAISVGLYTLWRYYWRSRKGKHLILETADLEKGDGFAFDNHGFKEGTPISRTLEGDKLKNIKWPDFITLQNGSGKMRSFDDSCIGQEPAKNIVPLRSHDFTGLGFNVYGNMRDGIYVKDVSHRGPASESGRIQPGDRITSVRISFRHMVYEDALTILSYASPYDVQIEVENSGGKGGNSRPSTLLRNKQSSSKTNERIVHPFFRSQSIPDLSQISSKHSSKRTSMNSHHNISHSRDNSESKPAILDTTPVTVKMGDRAHKFGVRVLPDMKQQDDFKPNESHSSNTSSMIMTLENEKNQNNSNIVIETNKTQQKSHYEKVDFDEIDLSDKTHNGNDSDYKMKRTNTPSPTTNVKSIIVKGIQNLKDKLHHQPNHKKQNSLEIPSPKPMDTSDSCVIDMNPSSHHNIESIVKDIPEEVKQQSNVVNKVSSSTVVVNEMKPPTPFNGVNKTDSFSSTEGDVGKRSKRKAPAPPVTTDVELHAQPTDVISKKDEVSDDIVGDGSTNSTTIELNSTHVTVHHIPDESSRKAASLGDLSKIINEDISTNSVLERAMSLEIADGINHPPVDEHIEEINFSKESRLDTIGATNLKKSSIFGNLEEMIQHDDSDSLISPNSGMSSPDMTEQSVTEHHEFVSSTPMKVSQFDDQHFSTSTTLNISKDDIDFSTSTPLKVSHVEVIKTETRLQNGDSEHNGNSEYGVSHNGDPHIHGDDEPEKPRPAQRMTFIGNKIETVEMNKPPVVEMTIKNEIIQEKYSTLPDEDKSKKIMENGHGNEHDHSQKENIVNGEYNGHNEQANSEEHNLKNWSDDVSESVLNDAYVTALNISVDEKPPDLPTSPPPNMNTFVTEIKVINRNENAMHHQHHDNEDEDDDDDILSISDKDMTLLEQECDDSKIFKNGVYFNTDESLLMNGNISSPFLTKTVNTTNSKVETYIKNINDKTAAAVAAQQQQESNNIINYSNDNLSDEQILALKTNNTTNKMNNNIYKNSTSTTTVNESPSPNKRRIPSKSPSPSSGKSPQRGNISITSIKSSGSRIPVRAFGGTNGNSTSSESSTTSSSSPRSMLNDPKVRKSRKPDESNIEQTSKLSFSSTSFSISPMSKSNLSSPEQRRYSGSNGTNENSVSHISVDSQK